MIDRLFFDTRGFTSAGIAVALLLVCALIFSSVHVYEVMDNAADVQRVADVAAVAAENEVAAFVTAARVADSLLLTLSLVAVTLTGVGIVCCCVPSGQTMAAQCFQASKEITKAQRTVAGHMIDALNALQQALPAVAVAQAVSVAHENSSERVSYTGVAELVPMKGDPIENPLSDDVLQDIDHMGDATEDLQKQAEQAEQASRQANNALHDAYMADCGNAPDYCMYERAGHLSSIAPQNNPFFHSQQTWSFQNALERAQEYYAVRTQDEVPGQGTFDEKIRSILRAHFYDYAHEKLSEGFVRFHDGHVVEVYLPSLPSSKAEFVGTTMYTNEVYPVSSGIEELPLLHAWSGCPACGDVIGHGSLAQLDQGLYDVCPECQLTTYEASRVTAASAVIENGFEYHYRLVQEAAERYTESMKDAVFYQDQVKTQAKGLFDTLQEALKSLAGSRIEIHPPGEYGAVAAVTADWSQTLQPLPFVSNESPPGGAAISAAILQDDTSENVVESLADSMQRIAGLDQLVGSSNIVGDIVAGVLTFHSQGVQGLSKVLEELGNHIPLASHSGLGTWASRQLEGLVKTAGLQPANISVPKVKVVNTRHVIEHAEGGLSLAVRKLKETLGIL